MAASAESPKWVLETGALEWLDQQKQITFMHDQFNAFGITAVLSCWMPFLYRSLDKATSKAIKRRAERENRELVKKTISKTGKKQWNLRSIDGDVAMEINIFNISIS